MKMHYGLVLLLFATWYGSTESQNIESLVPALQTFIELYNRYAGPSSNNPQDLLLVARMNKLQPPIEDDVSFPCSLNNTRSKTPPKSVHLLRPGDVNIIGAIGDSFTAGQSLLATSPADVFSQARGLSFSAGGEGTWRSFVTLPNILKEFNSKLIGYAKGDSLLSQKDSQFNVAESTALAKDMPFMAQLLIMRMEADPRVNIKSDWKMVNIFLGSFDFCVDVCVNHEDVAVKYGEKLNTTLKMLKKYLPRTIINVLLPPDPVALGSLTKQNKPPICTVVHDYFCPCIFNPRYQAKQDTLHKIWKKWHQVAVEVINQSEFDTEDFTVVLQPCTLQYEMPKTVDDLTDYSYLAADCIHMSQKENARAALSLWNNLMEPVGAKSETFSGLYNFKCPTAKHPYIFTRRNSKR